MPNERISMSKLKQLIGLQSSNLSVRALSRALGLSLGAVSKYLGATASLRACRIDAAEAEKLSEVELEQRVFGAATPVKASSWVRPDCAWIHSELKRHRHVTLQLLWEEYTAQHGAAAYRRSAFCQIYRNWEKRLKRSMRQRASGTLPARSCSSITRGPRCRSTGTAAPRRSKRIYSSLPWGRAAMPMPMPRRLAARRYRTGSAATCERSNIMAARPRSSSTILFPATKS